MLVVETIAKIGRAYFSLGKPIMEICRELLLIAQGRTEGDSLATEFPYQRDVQPQPKIGPWRERLDTLLLENDGKPTRERLTLIRVRIPTQSGRGFRFDVGRRSDLMSATIPK